MKYNEKYSWFKNGAFLLQHGTLVKKKKIRICANSIYSEYICVLLAYLPQQSIWEQNLLGTDIKHRSCPNVENL